MSYLKQVMEMLELEDMQEFEVVENNISLFRFNDETIEYLIKEYEFGWVDAIKKNEFNEILSKLINGTYTIKREWKPRDGDEYYIPDLLGKSLYMQDTWNWVEDKWRDLLVKRCIVFQTKEEAIECAKKMLEAIK